MKKIILGSVLALAASSITGCTTDNSGDDIQTGDHITTYNWQFSDIAFKGNNDTMETATGCPGGTFDTAAVISQQSSAAGVPVGSCNPDTVSNGTCFVDLYDCTAMTGTETLPEAYY